MQRMILAALAIFLPALLLACGGGSASGRSDGAESVVIEAPAEGAARYTTTSSPEPVVGENSAAIAVERGIRRGAEEMGAELEGDGRLALLSAWAAEHSSEGGALPPHEVMAFFAQHLGIVEPTPHIIVLGQPDPEVLEAGIADKVAEQLGRQNYTHFGAAVVPRRGLTIAYVTLSARHVEIAPVPREVSAGAPVPLTGRLLGAHSSPVLVYTDPRGETTRVPGGEGPLFEFSVPTEASGLYRVELLAQGPRGHTVVANFPLYVGVTAPRSVTLEGRDTAGGAPEEVAEELFRLINASREQAGIASLARTDELDDIARAHSSDMVDNGFVGHDSPTTGGAPDRVRRAGLSSGLILENIGRGYGAAEIHRGLMASPGHRANIHNPDVTHVGLGVIAEDESGRRAYVATELFLRMNSDVALDSASEVLLAAINDARRRRGADPVEIDPNLSRAAQNGADQYFEEPDLTQQDVVDEASASLRRFSIAFSRVGGLMAVVSQIEEAGRLEPTFDRDLRYVGIGVAQGSRPDVPSNSIAVVIMLAWPR